MPPILNIGNFPAVFLLSKLISLAVGEHILHDLNPSKFEICFMSHYMLNFYVFHVYFKKYAFCTCSVLFHIKTINFLSNSFCSNLLYSLPFYCSTSRYNEISHYFCRFCKLFLIVHFFAFYSLGHVLKAYRFTTVIYSW